MPIWFEERKKKQVMIRSLPTRLMILCAVMSAPAALGGVLPAHSLLLDFDTDANGDPIVHGQVIDDEYNPWGVDIAVQHQSDPSLDFGLALATDISVEEDMRTGTENGATHPTNTGFLGNVLITPRNSVDDNNDGVIDTPDTAYERPNGVFTFTFSATTYNGGSLTIIDAEEDGGTVEAWLNNAFVGSVSIPAIGDNAVAQLGLPQVAFNKLVIRLAGSGGVDNVIVNAVPEPASTAALALLGAGLLRRRR